MLSRCRTGRPIHQEPKQVSGFFILSLPRSHCPIQIRLWTVARLGRPFQKLCCVNRFRTRCARLDWVVAVNRCALTWNTFRQDEEEGQDLTYSRLCRFDCGGGNDRARAAATRYLACCLWRLFPYQIDVGSAIYRR